MKTPVRNQDLRCFDTSDVLSQEERYAVKREAQRKALGLTEPRVEIGKFHVPSTVARQFAYIDVSPR